MILAAIDCADEDNQQVCSDFGITGFPTMKVRLRVPGACWVSLCFALWPVPLLLNQTDRAIAPNTPLGALQAGAVSPFPKTVLCPGCTQCNCWAMEQQGGGETKMLLCGETQRLGLC